jgi:hypothetical protein
VRDVLLASDGKQTVLLARGNFHLTLPPSVKKFNYHGFVIVSNTYPATMDAAPPREKSGATHASKAGSGFCLLDSTLAAAGPLPILEAALDQYKSGNRNNATALLTRARAISEQYQFWGLTTGTGNFISENLPQAGSGQNGPDFARVFRSLQNISMVADLSKGLKGSAEGYCGSEQDAKTLSDALRGGVGMGRLNTPDNKPELLRLWDGIKVELAGKKVALNVDISQDLIDQLVDLVQHPQSNPHSRP